MSRLDEVAPRLARAHRDELAYQRRLAEQRRRGMLSLDVVTEEMVRSVRLVTRQGQLGFREAVEAMGVMLRG